MGHNFMSCHYVFVVEYIFIHFWLNCYEHLLRTFALPNKLSYGGFSNSHWKMVVWLFFSCQLRSDSQNWDFHRFQLSGSFSWLSSWSKQTKSAPNLKTTIVTWWTQNEFKNVVKIYFPVAKQEYPTEFEKKIENKCIKIYSIR